MYRVGQQKINQTERVSVSDTAQIHSNAALKHQAMSGAARRLAAEHPAVQRSAPTDALSHGSSNLAKLKTRFTAWVEKKRESSVLKQEIKRDLNVWFQTVPNTQAIRDYKMLVDLLKDGYQDRILQLTHKSYVTLPESFGNLTQLTRLFLRNNELVTLPESFGNLRELTRLSLIGNKLVLLPESFGNCRQLQELDLQDNKLKSLPESFGNLRELSFVRLANNQLQFLPESFGKLTNLHPILSLSNNKLSSLPESFGNLTQMVSISLDHNELTSLPDSFEKLKNLINLKLQDNQITRLPESFGNLRQLEHIDLRGNRLDNLPDSIRHLKNVSRLDLNGNQFTRVPRSLLELRNGEERTEVFLRNNPLPEDEIRAFRALILERREAGHYGPHFVLPALPEELLAIQNQALNNNNILRLAAIDELNVHSVALSNAFKVRLDTLAAQFPEQFKGSEKQQKSDLEDIEIRFMDWLDDYGASNSYQTTAYSLGINNPQEIRIFENKVKKYFDAKATAQKMFRKAYGKENEHYNDFKYTSGRVLAYVILAIEDQLKRTPAEHHAEAKFNGIRLLINFLAAGKDFCDSRNIEEVLQMVSIPLSEFAENAQKELVRIKAVTLSTDQLRDIVLPLAQKVLQRVTNEWPEPLLTNAEGKQALFTPQDFQSVIRNEILQLKWRDELFKEVQKDYSGIEADQLNSFVRDQIVRFWGTFVEHTLSE